MVAVSLSLQLGSEALAPQSLRVLASNILGLQIQEGEHSPLDDARAALYLYLKHRKAGLGAEVCAICFSAFQRPKAMQH